MYVCGYVDLHDVCMCVCCSRSYETALQCVHEVLLDECGAEALAMYTSMMCVAAMYTSMMCVCVCVLF